MKMTLLVLLIIIAFAFAVKMILMVLNLMVVGPCLMGAADFGGTD
jgi:hypothetical protein